MKYLFIGILLFSFLMVGIADIDNPVEVSANLTAANIPYYNGVEVLTFSTLLSLLPTKAVMELTVTNAITINASASMLRQPHMLTIFGTNTVTMGSQFSLAGTWTQTGTNHLSLFPTGQTTNWFYGVVTE